MKHAPLFGSDLQSAGERVDHDAIRRRYRPDVGLVVLIQDMLTVDGCHERQPMYDPELSALLCDVLTTLSRLNDSE